MQGTSCFYKLSGLANIFSNLVVLRLRLGSLFSDSTLDCPEAVRSWMAKFF